MLYRISTRAVMLPNMSMLCVTILLCVVNVAGERFLADLENEDIRVVRHRLEEEKEKRLLIQNDLEVLMLKFAKLERTIDGGGAVKLGGTLLKSTEAVAFHASYSKAHLQLTKGNTMRFDRVLSNQGDGYSPSSGIFRSPVEGTYFFSLHLLASGSKTLHNGIFKNDEMVGYTYAGDTGSQSVVIDLKAGDEVFVRAFVDGLVHGGNYCAFSGFLIK